MAAAKPMTKTQIITYFADKFDIPKKTAKEWVEAYADLAVAQTKKAGAFTMPGIGKITKVRRKARKGRNPATGAEIKIPAKTVVKCRLAKACADQIVPPKK